MTTLSNRSIRCLLLLSLTAAAATSFAAPPDHWVGTWASSPTAVNMRPVAPAAGATAPAPTTLATQPPAPPPTADAAPPRPPRVAPYGAVDTTYREIVHISLGGPMVRVVFTNEFGTDPLTIGAAQVAISQGGSGINAAASAGLTFAGHISVTIPAGALAVSDGVALNVPAGSDLAVSLFLPAQPLKVASVHGAAAQTNYTADGNVVGAKIFESPREMASWPFLKGVDVKVPAADAAIVALGDSITDGTGSTKNSNNRWPDYLARRLQANKSTAGIGVLNEGIGGNRILHDVSGPSALARFDRDVLAQAGVKYILMLEGINDIGHSEDPVKPYDVITADDLILGFTQLAERAHTHGIKFYAATIVPDGASKYDNPNEETMRQAVNKWIRTTNVIDGFVDFEKAAQDPANPARFLPDYDSGDHLHPKDAGYKAMADSIDLKLFEEKK